MTEQVFEKFKNEGVIDDQYLDHALLMEIDRLGNPGKQLVKVDVTIENGLARIDVNSNIHDVRTRVIKGDWTELQRFWKWFMVLPVKLADKEKEGLIGYAVKMKKPVDAYVIDGKIMPVQGNAYIDLK